MALDYFKLHFIVLIWGFTSILGLLIHLPATEMVFYRTFMATLILWVICRKRRLSLKISRSALIELVGVGSLICFHWLSFFISARISNASVSLMGMATTSIWTSLLAPIFYKQRIRWHEVVSAIWVASGLVVTTRSEGLSFNGLLISILSAVFGSLFTLYNERLGSKHHHLVITYYEMLSATVVAAIFIPFYNLIFNQPFQLSMRWIDGFYLIILSYFCTVYAFSQSIEIMKRISAFAVNMACNLEPVYGIILAYLIFGESEEMGSAFYLGGLIILVGVLGHPLLEKYMPSSPSPQKRSH